MTQYSTQRTVKRTSLRLPDPEFSDNTESNISFLTEDDGVTGQLTNPEHHIEDTSGTVRNTVSAQDGCKQTKLAFKHEPDRRHYEVRQHPRKRAASRSPQRNLTEEVPGRKTNKTSQFRLYARYILSQLARPIPGDVIQACGGAPLTIIRERPDDVLALAHSKLHATPFRDVHPCWLRLYEESTLYKVAQVLLEREELEDPYIRLGNAKAKQRQPHSDDAVEEGLAWLDDVVTRLDTGRIISGCLARSKLFDSTFESLSNIIPLTEVSDLPGHFGVIYHDLKDHHRAILRTNKCTSFEAFQGHLQSSGGPLIMGNIISHWPALERWRSPKYWLENTLGGRRCVPIEIGKSYVDEGWSQKIMPMHEFMSDYILPKHPSEIGYLAQHDLSKQFTFLERDFSIPDHYYARSIEHASNKEDTHEQNDEEVPHVPLVNTWFGPAHTKTPLHRDPYHNIFAQVVGYKYIRLYSPEYTANLYPRDTDEKGVNMDNTSSLDIKLFRPEVQGEDLTRATAMPGGDELARTAMERQYPLFRGVPYVEAVLGPGECLYIPSGWWHYVESLSTSISLSFWWS